MIHLEEKHPEIYRKLCDGIFVVSKTNNQFSTIGTDHNHKQINRTVKENSGAFYLENEDCVLTESLIVGPERARLIEEF